MLHLRPSYLSLLFRTLGVTRSLACISAPPLPHSTIFQAGFAVSEARDVALEEGYHIETGEPW